MPLDQFRVRGGLTFAGVNGEPRGLYETPKNNLMPRVGATFKVDEKTVLRGGYGVFYGFLGQRRGDVITIGFSSTTSMVPSLNNGLTFIETLSNPFVGGIQQPQGASQGIETFLGQSITFFDPEPESPRMQRWQIGIQRELPGQVVLEASYVGNKGTQIQTTRNINSTPLQYLSTSPTRDQATIDYLSANVPNPFVGADAGHRRYRVPIGDHRARTPPASVSPVRRGEHHDQRREVVVQLAAGRGAEALLVGLHPRRRTTPSRASRKRPSS